MDFERPTRPAARTASAAIVLVAGVLLSGCGLLPSPSLPTIPTPSTASSQPPAGTQSEQCAQLLTDVQAIAADAARLPEMLSSGNVIGAGALLGTISGRVGDLQTRVTDPALLERIEEIQSGWDALVEDATSSIEELDTAGIDRAIAGITDLTERVTALQEFCAGTE